MRFLRFTALACDELRYEAELLRTEKPTKRFGSIVFNLPQIESDPHGYERQVLADLQIGLMCLHEGDIDDRTVLFNIRDGA